MNECVTIGAATLWHGDSREIVPTLERPAAIITDPPYGLCEKMQGGTWGLNFVRRLEWDKAPESSDLAALLALSDICVFWGGNYFHLPPARCWLIWDKINAVPTMSDFEMAWTNINFPAKRFSGPVGRNNHGHPTEKPIKLMRWSIQQARIAPGSTVLDPYMGSGTTEVAATEMGHPFVGCEIDRRYFDIACKRIDDAQRQGTLDIGGYAHAAP